MRRTCRARYWSVNSVRWRSAATGLGAGQNMKPSQGSVANSNCRRRRCHSLSPTGPSAAELSWEERTGTTAPMLRPTTPALPLACEPVPPQADARRTTLRRCGSRAPSGCRRTVPATEVGRGSAIQPGGFGPLRPAIGRRRWGDYSNNAAATNHARLAGNRPHHVPFGALAAPTHRRVTARKPAGNQGSWRPRGRSGTALMSSQLRPRELVDCVRP